ncbi:MAG TPA: polysaccharide deacetylase family protein [Candidatus Acidoferrum sp.]|jgi:peptidoglycan/xylan/chitin deacetylase (PgdA/CDA1 family)|nr:polysaccharide deacetylase family protein [Candidatus Acidoferrum sp.]
MKNMLRFLLAIGMVCIVVSPAQSRAQQRQDRQVAITIDDLPAAVANSTPAAAINELTVKLLGTLRDQKVPVVGFVNERKLYKFGEVDERIKALRMWLDYGFELGNHTFSHMSLNQASLQAWKDDVVQGESVTRLLLAEHQTTLRYFRHPFLDTGRDLQTRREAEAFLIARGYRIAPVTLDAWDWMYAGVYEDAKNRGDSALQQQLVSSYLSYSDSVFAYTEQLAKQTIGYEPKQILLLHANLLEADHIGELLELMRKRGYRFITLADALSDQAYSLPDTFIGEEGTGWIDHWAITLGRPPQGAPVFPQWVIDRSKALHLPQP